MNNEVKEVCSCSSWKMSNQPTHQLLSRLSSPDSRSSRINVLKLLASDNDESICLDDFATLHVFDTLYTLLELPDSEVVELTYSAISFIFLNARQLSSATVSSLTKQFISSNCFAKVLNVLRSVPDSSPSNDFLSCLSTIEHLFSLPGTSSLEVPRLFIKCSGVQILFSLIKRPRVELVTRQRSVRILGSVEDLFTYVAKNIKYLRVILGHLGSGSAKEQMVGFEFLFAAISRISVFHSQFFVNLVQCEVLPNLLNILNFSESRRLSVMASFV
ncbi:hypothetical protein GEMRC1_003241 [Eukaryota sp. GEM-RC1]